MCLYIVAERLYIASIAIYFDFFVLFEFVLTYKQNIKLKFDRTVPMCSISNFIIIKQFYGDIFKFFLTCSLYNRWFTRTDVFVQLKDYKIRTCFF